ncbi:MAG: NADH-quinone oxidoreductase subunit N [Planctomycetota bacterium]
MEAFFPDLVAVGPELILCGTLLLVLMVDLWRMGRGHGFVWLVAFGTALAGCLALIHYGSVYNEATGGTDGLVLLPEFIGIAGSYALFTIADLWFRGRDRWVPGAIVMLGTAIAAYRLWGIGQEVFDGTAVVQDHWGALIHADGLGVLLRGLALLSLFFTALFTIFYRPMQRGLASRGVPEFLTCLVCAHLGGMLLVQTQHLLFLFLALEILSQCSYLQAGMLKGDRRSSEAGLKYVLYGSMASGLMLFGFSLLYAFTGELEIPAIRSAIIAGYGDLGLGQTEGLLLWLGVLLSLGGVFYKVSLVPFHFWAPDVYEGSPTPTTAFLAAGSKAVSFDLLVRLATWLGGIGYGPRLFELLAVVAALTMTYGNLAALRQGNLKRLFAYSSIAHAGYVMMGVVGLFAAGSGGDWTYQAAGSKGVLVYLLAYALMNLGAFGVVIYLANRAGSEEIGDLHGLGWKSPAIGAAMVVFLVSLTGLPPTVGFVGKLPCSWPR